ncbi:Proline-rich protein 2, partial [Mucuna pruriens]
MERQGALVCFWLLSVFYVVTGFNYGNQRTVEVVGIGECADCRENNIKTSHAFSGLHVTVDCKTAHGQYRTRGVGELDEYGNFKVSLPQDMVEEDGELKEDCYAQLHSASAEPCPSHGNSKIVPKSMSDEKHSLGPAAGKLRFSSTMCASAFFWHFFKHPNFPYPPKDNDQPPKDYYPKDPLPPKPPTYKKPPTSTPSPVVKKPYPPKEKTPSPTPIYRPLPPPTPVYNPLPPPTPISDPPVFKFFPPFPFKKNPCPPLPKMEPPKYFYQHPWFGNWPPSHS